MEADWKRSEPLANCSTDPMPFAFWRRFCRMKCWQGGGNPRRLTRFGRRHRSRTRMLTGKMPVTGVVEFGRAAASAMAYVIVTYLRSRAAALRAGQQGSQPGINGVRVSGSIDACIASP